jgi:predicted TIM-barrel fold metal-dependent hydrolase
VIIDPHCHAWRTWPYEPAVPDPTSRPAVEQLLFEMDQCGVDRAVLVAARIDYNPDNNDYAHYCVSRFPERLYQFADAYGPDRLHWGSDHPVVRWAMTYRHALEVIRTHAADIIPPLDMERVLGSSLYELLNRHGIQV